MVAACTGGSCGGGCTQDSGGALARYQLRPGVSESADTSSANHFVGVGVAGPGPEVSPVVLGQPAFGDAGELEQQHVPGLLALLQRAAEGDGVADRQDDQVVDAARCDQCQLPGQGAAPVVTYQVSPGDVQVG